MYQWSGSDESGVSTPQLRSRYQLLGGSVALKKQSVFVHLFSLFLFLLSKVLLYHYLIFLFSCSDGFHQVSCEAGSCVGVAGDMIKLYTFSHQLETNSS